MAINKVILIGNLGMKPEIKKLQNGTSVCNFTLATNEKWTDREGKKQEKTEWHKVVVWGKSAENCAQYLDKGRSAYVEGKLGYREYQSKDGQTKAVTEIIASDVRFL